MAPDGSVLKDFEAYNFLDGKAADTVNPSLWRHAQLNANYGLFKVTDGVYQLRGFDIANMTIIEGKTGWILVDPLTAPKRPVLRWPLPASTWATNRSPPWC
jgi:alkyl sulfatase BDS1-like metallo-beta-lactamase superfamily hydrolase